MLLILARTLAIPLLLSTWFKMRNMLSMVILRSIWSSMMTMMKMRMNIGLCRVDREHVELYNRSEVQMGELSRWRDDYRREMQKTRNCRKTLLCCRVERIKKLEEDIEPKSKQLSDAEERVRILERERTELVRDLAQSEMARGLSLGRKEDEIVAMLTNTSNLDIEGLKVWKDKHHELFTMQYPYVQKIDDSYRLPVDAPMKVSPNVPPPAIDDDAGPFVKNNDDGSAKPASLK
nr:hypothetical protein [Tanacetum cinerariifolium]